MQNTCISSGFALRCKGSLPFSFNDYTYCSSDGFCRHPSAYTSPLLLQSSSSSSCLTCCSCCANGNTLVCRVPIAPRYLYGLRQSTLIQWAPCKKMILGGFDPVYTRLPGCNVDRRCFWDKVCSFREKGVGRRRGRYECMVYEEDSERCSLDEVNDEAEVMLSLLTEEVGEEFFDLRGRNDKSSKKVVVEKRGKCGGSGVVYRGKKKNFGSGLLESSSKFEYESGIVKLRQEDKRRKEERREEGREALWRKGSREEEGNEVWRENQKVRGRKEERDDLLRRTCRKETVREDTLRESRKTSARHEEENLLREGHRERLRKDGSSCSSYYSLSSVGEFENENDLQAKQEEFVDYKNDSRRHGEVTFDGEIVERVERREDYSDERLVARGRNAAVSSEWNWRKESEKKLTDIPAEGIRSPKELSYKRSNVSDVHGDVYEKASYKKYGDQEDQITTAVKFDERSRRQHRQTGEDVLQKSETKTKYKHSTELSESRGAFATSSSSQKQHSNREDISTKAATSIWEARKEHYDRADRISREEEEYRKSHLVAQSSNTQVTDISKTSTLQLRSASASKDQKKSSTTIQSSVYDSEKHHQAGHFTRQEDCNVESISISQMESEQKMRAKGESSHLVYRSNQDSSNRNSQTNEAGGSSPITRVEGMTNAVVIHYSGSGTSGADEGSRQKPEAIVTPPSSQMVSRSGLRGDSSIRLAVEEVPQGSLSNDAAIQHGHNLDRPSALQPETFGGTRRDETIGQPLEFISQDDALGSADRLQKTSNYYVGEFVEKVRDELSSSEIHHERQTYEARKTHEHEQYEQKASTSSAPGDSQVKEHDLRSRHSSTASGTKGPSDEMWHVSEPSNQELPAAEVLEGTNLPSSVVAKRTGRSMWNIIGDIVRLRWASRSTNHSAAGKSGGRSSPNQSSISEAWFSGHEYQEGDTSQRKTISQKPSYADLQVEVKTQSQSHGESLSSSSSKDHIPPEQGSPLSYAVVAQGTSSGSTFLSSGEGTSQEHIGGTISGASMAGSSTPASAIQLGRSPAVQRASETRVVDSSIPTPAIQLRRSPAVERVSEAGLVDASADDKIMQTELPLSSGVSEISLPESKDTEPKRKKLQRTNQAMKDRFDEWEEAYRVESEQRKVDEMFMREALIEAKKAADSWEVPVGAVLVHDGKIIARGYNLVEELRDSTAHAEMICIREASNILRTWRLSETTLYVTLEPCPMCAGAILQARIDAVVWGAPNKLLGADGSWIRLFPSGEGESSSETSDKPPALVHPFHPKITVRRNILQSECAEAMQQFFQRRRKKQQEPPPPPTPPSSCLPVANHPIKFFSKMHDVFHIMFCL